MTRKTTTPPRRVERLDTCEKCGMPFAITAPPAVVTKLHKLWTRRHLCQPGRYEQGDQ